jgi:four helix bundle protein
MIESPVFARAYDLLQWLLRATEGFPRSQRFVLAKRIQEAAFDLQEALLEAGLERRGERAKSLQRADLALAKLRFHLRLSLDMQWLTLGQYEHVARMLDEIGRLLGGWQRKEREPQRPP